MEVFLIILFIIWLLCWAFNLPEENVKKSVNLTYASAITWASPRNWLFEVVLTKVIESAGYVPAAIDKCHQSFTRGHIEHGDPSAVAWADLRITLRVKYEYGDGKAEASLLFGAPPTMQFDERQGTGFAESVKSEVAFLVERFNEWVTIVTQKLDKSSSARNDKDGNNSAREYRDPKENGVDEDDDELAEDDYLDDDDEDDFGNEEPRRSRVPGESECRDEAVLGDLILQRYSLGQ